MLTHLIFFKMYFLPHLFSRVQSARYFGFTCQAQSVEEHCCLFPSHRPAHLSHHAYHCSRQFDGMLRRSGPTSAEAESIKL